MKTITKLLLGLFLFTGALTQAQVSVNVNIGTPPAWGPPAPVEARYYYLPDIATYYDINTGQYLYVSNRRWVRARALPPAYRSYNLYGGPKVIVNNYRGNAPYVYYRNQAGRYHRNHAPSRYAYAYRGAPRKSYKAVHYNNNRGNVHYNNNRGNSHNNHGGGGHGNNQGHGGHGRH